MLTYTQTQTHTYAIILTRHCKQRGIQIKHRQKNKNIMTQTIAEACTDTQHTNTHSGREVEKLKAKKI